MIILHGDNQIASRQAFLALKQQAISAGKQVQEYSGDSLSLPQLVTAVESVSLFGTVNAVFVDGLFSRRPSNEKKTLIAYLSDHPKADISVWEHKDVAAQVKTFAPASVRKFDLPKYLFVFLEHFTLPGLKQALTGSSPEQVFSLIVRQVRSLIMVKDNAGNLPAWQAGKLKSQAAGYSTEKLISLYRKLLAIDRAQKTSASPYGMETALELWVVEALQ